MKDIDRLSEAFGSGDFVRPSTDEPNLVDLSRTLASLNGVAGRARTSGCDKIAAAIGEGEHYVFVLVDGLGMSAIELLPADSFLRSHLKLALVTIFPSATTAALTTVATGCWPGEHGVTGWFTYLPDHGLTILPLRFVERFSGIPLDPDEVSPDRVFTAPAQLRSFTSKVQSVVPQQQVGTVTTRHFTGGTPAIGYESLEQAVDAVIRRVHEARGRNYTYLYYPGVDSTGHALGPLDPAYHVEVARVDTQLRRLAGDLPVSARLVISADHGCIPINETNRERLTDEDGLLTTLLVLPTGEGRTTHHHLRPGREQDFLKAFRRRFGERFLLVSKQEAVALNLFGPGSLRAAAQARVGDYIALGLGYQEILPEGMPELRGDHGGLTVDEMMVPLVVA